MSKNKSTQDSNQIQHDIETGLQEENTEIVPKQTNNTSNKKDNLTNHVDKITKQLAQTQQRIEKIVLPLIKNKDLNIAKENVKITQIPMSYEQQDPEILDPDTPVNTEGFNELHKRVSEKYGNMLNIENSSSLGLREELSCLDKLPPKLINFLNRTHLKINLISNPPKNIPETFYPIGHTNINLRNTYGYSFYTGSDRNCYITPAQDTLQNIFGSSSVALHEIGHGCHDILPIDLSTIKKAHLRLYNKLGWYYRQGGPGGITGIKEFFAESFSNFLIYPKPKFIAQYDEEWYNEIHRLVNIDYDKISKFDSKYTLNKPGDDILFTNSNYKYEAAFTQQDLDQIK